MITEVEFMIELSRVLVITQYYNIINAQSSDQDEIKTIPILTYRISYHSPHMKSWPLQPLILQVRVFLPSCISSR